MAVEMCAISIRWCPCFADSLCSGRSGLEAATDILAASRDAVFVGRDARDNVGCTDALHYQIAPALLEVAAVLEVKA